MKNLLGKIALVALLSVSSFGDDMQDAYDAFVKEDHKTAFKLYSSACENGDAGGCFVVGAYYQDGLSIQKDNQLALEYYTKACDMGNADGCKNATDLQNSIPICSEDELYFLKDKRYFEVSSSNESPIIVADASTIRIDKKNKIIQVWITFVYNQKGRDGWIRDLGEEYNNFGHNMRLKLINYGNMTSKSNTLTYYNCDGSSIDTDGAGEWRNIVPDSVMERITKTIMKKYQLK